MQDGEIVKKQSYDVQIRDFEKGLINFLDKLNLPSKNILVEIQERLVVFKNVGDVVNKIDSERKIKSVYISKFISAVASGLFDAALNYLWDETISELRRRVIQYDLSYFFDSAVNNPEKRKKLKNEEDLLKIDDSELIYGAREIELISDIGFKHLEYIRYMRNWISAAHPNQGEITGLQLISWLETCIKEVIALPLSNVVVQIKRLLTNIRSNVISDTEAREIATFFLELTQDQINTLSSGFFGIYTRTDTPTDTRNNIHKLLPLIWDRVDEQTKQGFGIRYAKYVANNDQIEKQYARQFLDLVSGAHYIPEDLRVVEIESALENLLTAHRGVDNFYNEPVFARQLSRIVGDKPVPKSIRIAYVLGLEEVYLTNGNGVAWNAEPTYLELIEKLNSEEALIIIVSFRNERIASRLQLNLPQQKYRVLLNKMKTKVTSPAALELIADIEKYGGSLDNMKKDDVLNKRVNNLLKVITG